MKNILKSFKLNENNISMLLGAAVIVIVGFLVVNYFRNIEDNGITLPSGGTSTEQAAIKLPTSHIVGSGETLWSIAEKYYRSGYNWVDIQKENNLSNASVITKGQTLVIPNVEARTATTKSSQLLAEATPSASPIAIVSPTPTEAAIPSTISGTTKGGTENVLTGGTQISGDTYTVVHGDNLWTIAVKAYGNGYKWAQIANANKLVHPGTIHAGNILQIPR